MKKLLLLIVVTFTFVTTVLSQEFFGGLILGGITSQVAGDSRGGYSKIGVTGGGFVGLKLSDDFDIQMELRYIQKGSRSTDVENRPATDPFRIKLDYVDLPIVFSYNLNKINVNDVNLSWLKIEFGLSLDVLLYAHQEIQGVVITSVNPWRRLAVNTVFGIRVNVFKDFEIGLRSIDAMTSICKSSNMPYNNGNVNYTRRLFGNYGMFNDVLQLAVFWRI